ncbi:hypothetical protein [Actinomyces sp.]
MKRRSLGVIGTLALAGTFAMATGSAIAAPSIDLEETYEFTSTTSGSYTLSMIDTSGTLISESICKSVQSAGATTAFRTSGSSHICDVSQSFKSSEIAEVLEVNGKDFTFTSQTETAISRLSSVMPGITMQKVTAKFSGGMVPTTADNGGTIDKATGTVTWTDVSDNVSVKGSTSSSSSSSSMKWVLLGILAVVVIGGIVFFVVMSNRKKTQAQPMGAPGAYPGAYPGAMPQPGQYPAPTGQAPADPTQYPQQGQYPQQPAQYPQAEQYPQQGQYPQQPGQYPDQGQQPGQYPQA